jgi:hypothetical protein
MKRKSIIFEELSIGMGATIQIGSDRIAATVVQVTYGEKRIVLQEDIATRIDQNGMSESQQYIYQTDTNGKLWYASKRKDGRWRISGSSMPVSLGVRDYYYDFSF